MEIWGSKGRIIANRIFTSPPGHQAELIFEKNGGKKVIKIETDNHFINMLLYFHSLIIDGKLLHTEYENNINQGRLISEFSKI